MNADIQQRLQAMKFAQDAAYDAAQAFHAREISSASYIEVELAAAQVRRIAAAGTPAVESP